MEATKTFDGEYSKKKKEQMSTVVERNRWMLRNLSTFKRLSSLIDDQSGPEIIEKRRQEKKKHSAWRDIMRD